MGFYFEVCEASCFLSIYRCGNDADSVLSSHSSPLCPPPPSSGLLPVHSGVQSGDAASRAGGASAAGPPLRLTGPTISQSILQFTRGSLSYSRLFLCSRLPVCLFTSCKDCETSQLHFDCWELFSAADDQKSAAAAPGWSVE